MQQSLPFTVTVPELDNVCQGEEIFVINYEGTEKSIRSHDYHEIYPIPGLYEHLFYDTYKCQSPEVVCSLLGQAIEKSKADVNDLTVLDVGAGNGMVGEKLVEMGVDSVIGIDIIAEAAEATERDRPGIYENYYVEDLTQMSERVYSEIEKFAPNCMTIVAALGFGDIPPQAFAEAYNMIDNPGWIAFNIKDAFCGADDCTGFARLIARMTETGVMDISARHQYRHRLCADGTPLYYYAIVGKKNADIPESLLANVI